ncbi:MAG: redoxin family protein [Planctomycetota bacterium]
MKPSLRMAARFVAAAVLASVVPLLAQSEPALLQAGTKAPEFTSVTLDGKEVRLADYAGKVVVLDFWATWCGPCIASFPHVESVAKAHQNDGVVVLAVCTSDTRAKFEEWVKAKGKDYPNLVFTCDPKDRGSEQFEQRASQALYHVKGIPTKFVIGKDGVITMAMVGHTDDDARLEAGLARAGVKVDAAVAEAGEKQATLAAAREAAEAKRLADNPPPPFYPTFGSIKHGEPMPDITLLGTDGKEFTLSSLRGKHVVIGWGWEEGLPRQVLNEIQTTYAAYGVQCVGAMVMTDKSFFDEWSKKHATDGFRLGFDPAGKYTDASGNATDESRAAWDKVAVIRKFFKGNMLPAMPTFVACDQDGELLGSFPARNWQEAMGNLLLRSGVPLEAAHRPKVVVKPEAFVVPAPRAPEAKVERIQVGAMAPDFAMVTTEGKPMKLSDYRGKIVVLDFWATWCGPCVAAMPHVQELADHYADQGVVVLASCTSDERKKFDDWVAQRTQEFPNVMFAFDPQEKSPERASRKLYGVGGIPQQFVIGKDGTIVAEVSGYMKGEVLLDAALAKAGVKVDEAVLEQAKKDQAARDARKSDSKPAVPLKAPGSVPMKPMTPGGG